MAARQILCLVLCCLSRLNLSEAGLRQKITETSVDVAVGEDVAIAEGDEVSQEYDQPDGRRLATAKKVGDDSDGSGFSVFPLFPLGLCEGDCDSNSDCAGDLVCFQRDPGDGVTSDCSASSSFISETTDICVKKSSSESSSSGSDGGSTSGSAILRLWWKKGYMWQEDPTEKKWCLKCQGSGCNSGDQMIIVNCVTDNPTRIQFVRYGDEFMMKPRGSNLCFELNNDTKNYELKGCDSSKSTQRFRSGNGSPFGSGRFEMYPKSKSGFCLTQRHHPKWGEALRAETCSAARGDDTSYWIKY